MDLATLNFHTLYILDTYWHFSVWMKAGTGEILVLVYLKKGLTVRLRLFYGSPHVSANVFADPFAMRTMRPV